MFRRKIRYLLFCFWSLVEDQAAYKAGYPAPIYGIQPDIGAGYPSSYFWVMSYFLACCESVDRVTYEKTKVGLFQRVVLFFVAFDNCCFFTNLMSKLYFMLLNNV